MKTELEELYDELTRLKKEVALSSTNKKEEVQPLPKEKAKETIKQMFNGDTKETVSQNREATVNYIMDRFPFSEILPIIKDKLVREPQIRVHCRSMLEHVYDYINNSGDEDRVVSQYGFVAESWFDEDGFIKLKLSYVAASEESNIE